VSQIHETVLMQGIYQCGLVQERIAADILSLGRIQVGSLSLYNTERDIISEARKVGRMSDWMLTTGTRCFRFRAQNEEHPARVEARGYIGTPECFDVDDRSCTPGPSCHESGLQRHSIHSQQSSSIDHRDLRSVVDQARARHMWATQGIPNQSCLFGCW